MIRIRRRALTQLQRTLMAALPCEGCALLLGEIGPAQGTASANDPGAGSLGSGPPMPADGDGLWRLQWIWPCLNVWEPPEQRLRRFAIDPREQLLAQRWARQRQLTLLGTAHSHPQGEARPSATDLGLAYTPSLQLILAPADAWLPRAWWLEGSPDGASACRPLPWLLED